MIIESSIIKTCNRYTNRWRTKFSGCFVLVYLHFVVLFSCKCYIISADVSRLICSEIFKKLLYTFSLFWLSASPEGTKYSIMNKSIVTRSKGIVLSIFSSALSTSNEKKLMCVICCF